MRVQLLGIPVDILSASQTLEMVDDAMCNRRPLQHVAMNVAKLVKMKSDRELRDDVMGSDIIGIDGMGIVVAARLEGHRNAERVSGVDLMENVLALCAKKNFKPYFLGARPEVVARAASLAQERFPGLQFAGYRDGYFNRDSEPEVVARIAASRADCLFIGMPTPRKERLLAAHRHELGVPFIMGVGGGFDVLAGKVSRAPSWMQNAGLEWAYRIYQEPGRMWWRYLHTNTVFAAMLLGQSARRLLPLRRR
jgi:N-acetylglucosaminyldiphosphoundecaprenol N-acetyl-beta-D-mannosaminyltransferase